VHRGLADRVLVGVDLVALGVTLISTDELFDVAIQGGGEEQRLTVLLYLVEDLPHNRHESHVSHSVSLIDDDDLDITEADGALVHKVHEASGTGHRNVDSTA
jgi:hypothetical protein